MAAKTIFWYCAIMLISNKTTGSIYFLFVTLIWFDLIFYFILFYFILFYFILFYFILFYFILFYFILFFASKEAYQIVRQLEKNNGQKSASESTKMLENKCWIHRNPRSFGHLSVKVWKFLLYLPTQVTVKLFYFTLPEPEIFTLVIFCMVLYSWLLICTL